MSHRRDLRTVLFALPVAALLHVPALSSTAEAAKPTAHVANARAEARGFVVQASGSIRSTRAAPWRPLVAGDALPAWAEVESKTETLKLRLANGATVELEPGSLVSFAGKTTALVGTRTLVAARIVIHRGNARVVVPKNVAPGAAVAVGFDDVLALASAGATMGVRLLAAKGTEAPRLAVASYEGELRVTTRGVFAPLPARAFVELRAKQSVPPSQPLPRTPEWVREVGVDRGGQLAVVTGAGSTATLTLRFEPAANASGYQVEFARDAAFMDVVTRTELPSSASKVVTPPLPEGRYFARLRPRCSAGFFGSMGATRELRIARLAVPPGTVAKSGVLYLPRGGMLAVHGAAGLEASVGLGAFLPAERLRLAPKSASTTARLRLAGAASYVPITLAPRTLAAQVELGSKLAVWPKDAVYATVRLVDGELPIDAAFKPRMKVTINAEEVALQWTRRGHVWTGRVPPRHGSGPYVIRVNVADPHGNELGSGYLEVLGRGH